MAADQVLEMDIVTPCGNILTINDCQNQDLFCAMRGGGGSTFGIITSATIKAYPSFPFAVVSFLIGTENASDAYWSMVASMLSQYLAHLAKGIAGLPFILPSYENPALNITTPVAAYAGTFSLSVLSPSNTSDSLAAALTTVFNSSIEPYLG